LDDKYVSGGVNGATLYTQDLEIWNACEAKKVNTSLTNKDVIDLKNSGISDDVIVAKIKASACHFDTSVDDLKALKAAGISDAVMFAMVDTTPKPSAAVPVAPIAAPAPPPPSIPPELLQDRQEAAASCPTCKTFVLSYVDSRTGQVTDNWGTKHQWDLMKQRGEQVSQGKLKPLLHAVRYRQNADYVFFWTQAVGSRTYVTYVPQTTTSESTVYGNYNGYNTGSGNSTYGNFNGTISTTSTSYTPQANQWNYVNVTLSVYDKYGNKVYETWHQGNFRWSKPEKDCLEDALNYLHKILE
jgi:hypothetical protein